jgi:V8-like Glu-specific endopeptidase
MPSISRPFVVAAVVALIAVTATACGASGDNADANPSAAATVSGTNGLTLPTSLPTSLADLDKWKDALKNGGWKDWDKSKWLRDAADFINPVIDGLWDPSRMQNAGQSDKQVASDVAGDAGQTDPEPAPVQAAAVKTPYSQNAQGVGKIFFDTPEGSAVCSGTVVKDPAHPGKSNLVWTAGHCVHAGKSGGWFRNIVFVPAYNDNGLSAAQVQNATRAQVAPKGVWWADGAQTSAQWIAQGAETGGSGSPFDFAVLHVTPEAGTGGKSLEEAVGAALPVWFDAPSATQIASIGVWGYPAAAPFDGQSMFDCVGKPGRLSIDPNAPTEYRVGCTMTGGSSGGGWYATMPDGNVGLVSNTSIGPATPRWLAGPHLGSVAKDVYDSVSQKFG